MTARDPERRLRRVDRYQLTAFIILFIAAFVAVYKVQGVAQQNRELIVANRSQLLQIKQQQQQIAQEQRRREAGDTAAARRTCIEVQGLNRKIDKLLVSQLRELPSQPYYKAHPGELPRAEREILAAVKTFQPKACPPLNHG